MKLLLDTHIWLWSLKDEGKLSARVRRALESGKNQLWLSPVSIWESLVLADRGRVQLEPEPSTFLENALKVVPMHDAPFTHEVALKLRSMRIASRDPADQILTATAAVFDLTLVTADRHLLGQKGYKSLPNA